MREYQNFPDLFYAIKEQLYSNSHKVHGDRWQSMDIKGRPDMISFELLNFSFSIQLKSEDLGYYRENVQPNLPWADDHFLERICGYPINPGTQWANWPWGKSAAKHRNAEEKFNHNYMERYWPKRAGFVKQGTRNVGEYQDALQQAGSLDSRPPLKGIANWYGDMGDVIQLLLRDPLTRQAYIPIFFPEDTGFGDGQRKPCTLGYQFIVRDNKLHIYYPMRSCDFMRHFKDDIYLTIRLLLWVLEECRKEDPKFWNTITPGTLAMHCTSLHIFTNDWVTLFGEKPKL